MPGCRASLDDEVREVHRAHRPRFGIGAAPRRRVRRQRLQAERAFGLEYEIAGHHWDNVASRDAVKTYNLKTWDEFQQLAGVDLTSWRDAVAGPAGSAAFAEIVAYFEHPYTNAVLEGADSVIQNVKRRARGFRNMDYFATMIYLTCGRLDLKAVTTT